MTGPASDSGWREAGRRLATPLDRYTAVVVLAADLDAAGSVARGIAEALGGYREVVIADLSGGLGLVQELGDASAEGIGESFEYGISLARVAHRSAVLPNVSVIPAGIERTEREEMFRSGRWQRFAERCRVQGSLLLLVARDDEPAIDDLAARVDGAIIVGGSARETSGFRVLYRVQEPVPDPWKADGRGGRSRLVAAAAAVVLLSAAIAGTVALRASRQTPAPAQPPPAPAPVPVAVTSAPVPTNPADSAVASAYAVELMSANTADGANFELRRFRNSLAAATIVPMAVGAERATWYRIVVGAFAEPAQADSLLRLARSRRLIADSAGRMIHAPLALLVDSVAAGRPAVPVVGQHLSRGVPVYALMQPDGRALVYAGAFERPEDSEILSQQVRAAGVTPTLVYRTGRSP